MTSTRSLDVNTVDEEWICSKRLATESRLSADWHGPSSGDGPARSRLSIVEDVDFSRILDKELTPTRRVFTVSACGKFVVVVTGGDILVYRLWDTDQTILPVVRLAPGIQVLEVSMDTRSDRYSIAALLECRIGMLWDISRGPADTRRRNGPGEPLNLGLQTDIQSSARIPVPNPLAFNLPMRSGELLAADAADSEVSPLAMLSSTSSLGFDEHFSGQDNTQSSNSTDDSDDEYAGVRIPIQTRPTAIYTDLGSSDDLPRSVAICPNRKCVAFGCRLGIELHWVDALTGGDLNRWFPLAAPSDHLYFLPQRPGIDSRKKLRLISSAAGPLAAPPRRSDGLPTTWKYSPASAAHGRRQSLTRLFFGNLPFPESKGPPGSSSDFEPPVEGDEARGGLRTVDCDHFRAVPISDGSHLLFTDPSTGLLCLGSDGPSGGPTKLIRKVMFSPPPTNEGGDGSMPLLYSAGQALEWGLRVVAFHADGHVVLYNVPSDTFQQIQALQTTPDAWDEMDSQTHTRPTRSTGHDSANRYISITGAIITRVEEDLVDGLAVDSEGGGFSLWTFYRSGRAELRHIYSPSNFQKRVRYVGDNGLVYEVHDEVKSDTEEASPQRCEENTPQGKAPRRIQVKWAGVHGDSSI
ncbi:hypothetical protein A1O3_08714 [Capronia epimyces CBS 606.96]|uniref:Uncharacterized protein n=1 Tax=Capronia epimyces CBS 606.96 TaxID=1182542 RepID=W9XG43_9EURO|nr:uncharacterized protein A1O3_08714 [Capronia epimyces CBS 606.96]EXJ79213.1 hypothetical protein A1O3_08714 [Capronia epimyces CBS 606.96]